MPVIPFSSAPRIARDAQAAADAQEAQAAAEGRRYRQAADAKLDELRSQGVKKFDAQGGKPMINVPDPVPAGGARLNAPGVETPDMREPGGYFSDNYQPEPGDELWNQFESDRTGPNKPMDGYALGGQSVNGQGGPDNPIQDPALASIAEKMIARQKERASYSLTAGLMQSTATPDQAAADVETASKAGVSRVQVEADRKTFALKLQQEEFDKLSNESPLTYSWLTQDYDNLEVAKDDATNLAWWETAGRMIYNTPGALYASGVSFLESSLGVTQMGVDAGDELGRSPSPAMAAIFGNPREADRIARDLNARGTGGTLPQDPNSPLAATSRFINTPRMSLREYKNAVMPKGASDIESGYYSGVVSMGQNAPLIIASALTKNPAIMTMGMTASTAGEAYSRATDEHPELSYGQRAGYALTQAGIEFLTEVGPNALFVEALLKGSIKEQIVGFGKQQIVEQFGEQTATAFQDMNDWLTLKPDATWEDYLKERPSAALQTFVATLVAGGGQVALGKASDAVGQRLDAANQQKRAEDLANFVRAMGDNAKDSKLLKRLPDKYREAVVAVTKDGPRENVRINPEGIAELAQSQGVTPEQLAQAFRIDPETMVQAMDTGDDIVVPSGNFAAVIQTAKKDIGVSGETIYQALAPHIRLNANDFTARESEAFQKVAKAEADARAEWNATENDFAASSETVETDIRDQIRATGRFNEDTVDGQAKLMGQLVNVIAKQTGQDPADVWKNDGFNIMSAVTGEQTEGAVLPQGAELSADATPTQRLIDMRAKGSSNAEIAAALYPDVEPKAAVNRVKALASKHKGKIEERKAALEGKELAQDGAAPKDIRTVLDDMSADPNEVERQIENLRSMSLSDLQKLAADYSGDTSVKTKNAAVGVIKMAYGTRYQMAQREARINLVEDFGGGLRGQDFADIVSLARKGDTKDALRLLQNIRGVQTSEIELLAKKITGKDVRGKSAALDAIKNAAPSSDLASGGNTPNATIALGRTRALIKMFEGANLSSLAHEGAHWYLDLLFRMSKSENPHPFVQAQMARILEFAGKSQEWDGMFDAKGDFTEEGRKLQEQFAEAFEVYLMTGKAPSVGMRSVFNTFKQWILGVYKAFKKGVGQAVRDVGPYTQARIAAKERELGRRLNDQELVEFVVPQELRDVFDRMLATEDAINAAQTNMVRDSEAMAKAMLEKLDPDGKWKPERQQKFMDRMRERYAEAKERAEAALMARLMDEYTRARSTVAREEERDIRQEVASEIDEQPAQRVYQVLSGQGWRDTRADHAEEQADAAEVMATLAQMVSTEQRQAWQLERGAVDDTPYYFGTYSAGVLGDIENYDLSKAGSQSGSGERAMFLTTSSRRANTYADPGMGSANEYFTREEDPARWEKVRDFLGGASVSDAAVRGYISRSVDTPGVFKAYVRGPVRDVDWAEYTGSVTFDDEAMKRLIDEEMARPEGPRNLRITNIADGGNDRAAVNMVVLDPDNVMNAISSSRADDAGSSLAQSQTHDPAGERELDALGFYSAVFEAAKSVRPDVWSMGWDHARNSIVKGGAKINGQRVAPRESEMAYLGLDEMFYGTKLKGAELAEAVLSHIQAKRLLLTENFARFDPNAKAPSKAAMLDEMDDDTLANMIGVDTVSTGGGSGRIFASELDGANEFNTGLFVQLNKELSDTRADDIIPDRKAALDFMFSLSGGYTREQWDAEVGAAFEFVPDNKVIDQARTKWAVKNNSTQRRTFDLYRVLDGGKRELIDTGVIGDLTGKAARLIVDENRNLILRKISAETMADAWRDFQTDRSGGLVRGPGDIRLPGEDVPLFESVIGLPEGVPGSDYQAPRSHVGGKAKGTLVTAHGEERIDDKGQRTLFTGQVQSDMAQQAREEKDHIKLALETRQLLNDNPDALWFTLDSKERYHVSSPNMSRNEAIAEANDAFDAYVTELRKKYTDPKDSLYDVANEEERKVWDKLEADWESAQSILEYGRYTREMVENWVNKTAQVDGAPLLSTSEWTNVGVRAMVYRAARDGFASVSFPTSETSEIIQGNDTAAQHYDTNVKGALEKIGKQLGGEMRRGSVTYDSDATAEDPRGVQYNSRDGFRYVVLAPDGSAYDAFKTPEAAHKAIGALGAGYSLQEYGKAPAYILDITPEMRRKIVSRGFPLFQTRTGKDRIAQPAHIPIMRLDLKAVEEQFGPEALAALPEDVRDFSAKATDADRWLDVADATRKTLKERKPKPLWKFLSRAYRIGEGNDRITYRGIRDPDGEILAIIGEKKAAPGLIAPEEDGKRARSYDIEHAARVAWEQGYFSGESPPTPREFLDALRADFDGQAPLYRRDDIPTVLILKNAEVYAKWFDEMGIDINEKDEAKLRAQIEVQLSGQNETAIGPDEAAPYFGMRDGRELLEGLKQGPLRDKLIREETKRRMIERHGDTFSDGTMINEAMAYARNEIQHRQFEIELEALADAAGQRAQANLAKQTAIDNLRSKQVREVLNYNQWLTLSERWGKKAVEAAAKGDMAKAMEFARYRLINSHMYTEGKKLAEKIEKTRTHLLDYGKKTKQARLFAAGAEYQANMNGLLSDYQFRNESKKGESQRAARGAWIKAQMAGIDPYAAYQDNTKSNAEKQAEAAEQLEKSQLLATLGEGADAKGYKSLTVEEMMAVRDEADLIWKLATLKDRLLKEGERRRLSLAAQDVAAEIEANQPNEKPPEPIETDAPGYKLKRGGLKYFAMHRTLQSLARQFAGGKDGGKFWNYIVRPLNEAFARLSTIRHQMGKDVGDLFSAYTEDEKRRMFRDRQTFDFTQSGGPRITLSKQGRLAFALNWGNDKNRRRLMDSLGLDAAMVGQVLDTLDKRDWDFVQKTWDYLDTWFPEANRVHEAVHGAPMDKEDPLKVATRFGIYSGGYYPIKFDPMLSSKTGQRQVMADSKAMTGQVGQRNAPGFTKARTKGKVTLPLRLSVLDVITGHLDQVATSIATEEAFFDAGRIIKQAEVENAIVTRHGREVYNTIVNMLVTAKFGLEGASGVLAHLRNGATVVGLGWKVGTALLQPLGISNSIVRVGGFWIAKGYAMMGHDAVTVKRRATWATERSEFMRNRREANSPEMAALRKDLKASVIDLPIRIPGLRLTKKAMDAIKDNAFAMMANVQFYSVDVPTWYGALLKAQAASMSEADAIAEADQAVIDAQGGGELHQTAAMQTGAGTRYAAALRLLTNFMSYMVTTYNLATQRARNARTPAQLAALAFDMAILFSIPVAGKMLLDAWTKGGGDGEDDDDPLWEAYMREQIAFLLSPFVGISQVAGTVRGDDAYGYRGPAGLGVFAEATNAGKALAEADFDASFWRPANKVAGMVFHYPASQIDASIRGAAAYFNGETDNPAAFLVGPPPSN